MIPRYVRAAALIGTALLLAGALGGCPSICPECPEPNCPECPEPNTPEPNVPEPNTPEKATHEKIFTEILSDANYKGTTSCLNCHSDKAFDILETAHWNWSGPVTSIPGLENQSHGKVDLLNNF